MSKLSSCIFEWDQDDHDWLLSAKKAELVCAGVRNLAATAVCKALSKEELAQHFR